MLGITNSPKVIEKEVVKEVGRPTTIGTGVQYWIGNSSNISNGVATFTCPAGKKIIGIATRFYNTEQLWIDVENRQVWYCGSDNNYAYRLCPESASMFTYVSGNVVKMQGYKNPAGYSRGPSNNCQAWIIYS